MANKGTEWKNTGEGWEESINQLIPPLSLFIKGICSHPKLHIYLPLNLVHWEQKKSLLLISLCLLYIYIFMTAIAMWDYNTKSHFQVICIKIILLWLLVNVQTVFLRDSFDDSRANSEQSSECYQKAVGCFWVNYIEWNFPHPQPHWNDVSKLKKSKNYIQIRYALKLFCSRVKLYTEETWWAKGLFSTLHVSNL